MSVLRFVKGLYTRTLVLFLVGCALLIFIVSPSYAQKTSTEQTDNISKRYYRTRVFDNQRFSWNFTHRVKKEDLKENQYYYVVYFNYRKEITRINAIYNDIIIFNYNFPIVNKLKREEKITRNLRALYYFDENGKPVILEKYTNGIIESVIRYDSEGRRRITEVYEHSYIKSVSYTNNEGVFVFKQIYENPGEKITKPTSTEIIVYNIAQEKENEDRTETVLDIEPLYTVDRNEETDTEAVEDEPPVNEPSNYNELHIFINNQSNLKHLTYLIDGRKVKVIRYVEGVIDKIYYYDVESNLIQKVEVFDKDGNLIDIYYSKDYQTENDKADSNNNTNNDESNNDNENSNHTMNSNSA